MAELPKYYTLLFNAVEDAVADLEQQNYGCARQRLIRALNDAEEAYLDSGEEGRGEAVAPRADGE